MRGPPWLILPTYDEAENVEAVTTAAMGVLEECSPGAWRILIVDDSSPDGTGRIADRLSARHPGVQVLHRPRREGLGPAYLAGFAEALAGDAGFVFEMDADFSHDPADLALGSRYAPGGAIEDWGTLRRLLSRGGSLYAQRTLGLDVQDLTGGFKCFRRDVLESIDLETVRSRGYAFQVELTYRAVRNGFRVREVPITFRDRLRGRSKMSARIAFEAAWLVPRLRRRR